jgi:hypothetical protein
MVINSQIVMIIIIASAPGSVLVFHLLVLINYLNNNDNNRCQWVGSVLVFHTQVLINSLNNNNTSQWVPEPN